MRNAFFNFIVVELIRSIDSRATYAYSDFVTNFKLCRLNIYIYIFPIMNCIHNKLDCVTMIYVPILKSERSQNLGNRWQINNAKIDCVFLITDLQVAINLKN